LSERWKNRKTKSYFTAEGAEKNGSLSKGKKTTRLTAKAQRTQRKKDACKTKTHFTAEDAEKGRLL